MRLNLIALVFVGFTTFTKEEERNVNCDFDPDLTLFEDDNLESLRKLLKTRGCGGDPNVYTNFLQDLKQRDKNLHDYLISFMNKQKDEIPPPDYYLFLGNKNSPRPDLEVEVDASPISSVFWRIGGDSDDQKRHKRSSENQHLQRPTATDYWKQPSANHPKELVNYLTSFINKPENERPPPDYFFYLGNQLGKHRQEEGPRNPQETTTTSETAKGLQGTTENLQDMSGDIPVSTVSSLDVSGISQASTERTTDTDKAQENSSNEAKRTTDVFENSFEITEVSQGVKPVTENQEEPITEFGPAFWTNFKLSSKKTTQITRKKRDVPIPLIEHNFQLQDQKLGNFDGFRKFQFNSYNELQSKPHVHNTHYKYTPLRQLQDLINQQSLNQVLFSTTLWPAHVKLNQAQSPTPHFNSNWNSNSYQMQHSHDPFNLFSTHYQNFPTNTDFIPYNQMSGAVQRRPTPNKGSQPNRLQNLFVSVAQKPSIHHQGNVFKPSTQSPPTFQGLFRPAQIPQQPQGDTFYKPSQRPSIPQESVFGSDHSSANIAQANTFKQAHQKTANHHVNIYPQVGNSLIAKNPPVSKGVHAIQNQTKSVDENFSFPLAKTPLTSENENGSLEDMNSQKEEITIIYPKEDIEYLPETTSEVTKEATEISAQLPGNTHAPELDEVEDYTISPNFWKASQDFISIPTATNRTRRHAEIKSYVSRDKWENPILSKENFFSDTGEDIIKQSMPHRDGKFPYQDSYVSSKNQNLDGVQNPFFIFRHPDHWHLKIPFNSNHLTSQHNPQPFGLSTSEISNQFQPEDGRRQPIIDQEVMREDEEVEIVMPDAFRDSENVRGSEFGFSYPNRVSTERPRTTTLPGPPTWATPPSTCVQRCLRSSTREYNPICGTDAVTYRNPGRLRCEQLCGKGNVEVNYFGNCITTTTTFRPPPTTSSDTDSSKARFRDPRRSFYFTI